MTNFTELQLYLLKRMRFFEKNEAMGISVFSWTTTDEAFEFSRDLPTTFKPVVKLQFSTACAWADLDSKALVTWRKIAFAKEPFVNLYRFDDKARLVRELEAMINNSEGWLSLGGTEI